MNSKANWIIVDLEMGQYEHNSFSCILQLSKYTYRRAVSVLRFKEIVVALFVRWRRSSSNSVTSCSNTASSSVISLQPSLSPFKDNIPQVTLNIIVIIRPTTHLTRMHQTRHMTPLVDLLPQPCPWHCCHHTPNWTQPPKLTPLQASMTDDLHCPWCPTQPDSPEHLLRPRKGQ